MLETIWLYASLFFTSFLASTIVPLGSEGFVVYLITQGHNFGIVVGTASIGNYLGACTTYLLGWVGREQYLEKYLRMKHSELERGEHIFEKYGPPILLFTWVPLAGDAIAAIGGIFKLNFAVFSLYVFTGKFLRYLAVAYLAGLI